MELREDIVDIIVPFFRNPDGEKNLEVLQKSLKEIDPGFPYNLIIAEGQKPCVQNRNDGLRQSNSRYVIMCDDDVIFKQPNWLKEAMEAIKMFDRIGMVGFRIEDKHGKIINAGRTIIPLEGKEYSASVDCLDFKDGNEYRTVTKNMVGGCCVLLDRTVAGYYPERLYPGKLNSEDTDYQLTIQANGYDILYLGNVAVIHNEKTPKEKALKYNLTEQDLINHIIFKQRWKLENATIKLKEEPIEQEVKEELTVIEPEKK